MLWAYSKEENTVYTKVWKLFLEYISIPNLAHNHLNACTLLQLFTCMHTHTHSRTRTHTHTHSSTDINFFKFDFSATE